MSVYVVGVSGGIGSGKSTVTDMFALRGIEVVDADVIAREVVEPHTEAFAAIVKKFGSDVVAQSGQLDRAKLRAWVFSHEQNKSWLNALLHPLIRQQMTQQTQQAASIYCLLSVPLLVENKLYQQVDRVLIVDVNEATQLARAVKRDQSNQEQIKAIMQAQASRAQRLAVADDVIDNNGSTEDLHEQVNLLHQQYLKLAAKQAQA